MKLEISVKKGEEDVIFLGLKIKLASRVNDKNTDRMGFQVIFDHYGAIKHPSCPNTYEAPVIKVHLCGLGN